MCIPKYVSVRCYDMSNLVFVSKLIYLFHDNAPLLFKGWYQNMYPFEGMSDDVYCRLYLCFKTLLKIAPQFPDCCGFHKGKERKKIINKEENKKLYMSQSDCLFTCHVSPGVYTYHSERACSQMINRVTCYFKLAETWWNGHTSPKIPRSSISSSQSGAW